MVKSLNQYYGANSKKTAKFCSKFLTSSFFSVFLPQKMLKKYYSIKDTGWNIPTKKYSSYLSRFFFKVTLSTCRIETGSWIERKHQIETRCNKCLKNYESRLLTINCFSDFQNVLRYTRLDYGFLLRNCFLTYMLYILTS